MLNLGEYATIGVFGHFGNRNLGDEAIITAVIQNIRLRLPNAKIIGFSLKPDDTAVRHDIRAYAIRHLPQARSGHTSVLYQQDVAGDNPNPNSQPIIGGAGNKLIKRTKEFIKRIPLGQKAIIVARALIESVPAFIKETRFLRRSYKVLKEVDVVMIAGSNQLMDSFGGCNEGPRGFPYTLLKWTTMAKLAGSKVVYVSVGAGPIASRLSKAMIKLALRLSDYTSFRDARSQQLIEALGVKGAKAVFPDLAYSLRPAREPTESGYSRQRGAKPTVGINPMPVFDNRYWYIHDADRYASYVKNLAAFSAVLFREGYPLVFWGTQPKDQDVITDVLVCLEKQLDEAVNMDELVSAASSVDELLDVVDSLDIAIATRFHGVVLSLSAGTAVMSVCYHKKMDDLMKEMEQSQYSVMFDALDAGNLLRTFKRLEQKMDNEVEKIERKTAEYRKALARQYDLLFGAPVQAKSDLI